MVGSEERGYVCGSGKLSGQGIRNMKEAEPSGEQ